MRKVPCASEPLLAPLRLPLFVPLSVPLFVPLLAVAITAVTGS
ncbi:hypothetical protein ACFVVU_14330 [Kitasatospora sp. NPDC057965]